MDTKSTWVDLHDGERFGNGGVKKNCKQCKDCIFRDKTTVRNEECGWYKCICNIFESPEDKPHEVMENIAECEYYEKAD